jgi:hypothetical protein
MRRSIIVASMRAPLALGAALLLAIGALLAAPSCKSGSSAGDDGVDACAILFGSPNAQTGLGSDQCRPQCTCEGTSFVPPTYDASFIQSLITDFQLTTPYAPLTSDPYDDGGAPADDPPDTVCGVVEQLDAGGPPRPYTLVTYPSTDAATAAGARVTHFGHCGVCSTLANLAVYMANDDLVGPVRQCGVQTSTDGGNADVSCLMQLGFDLPCAQAWAYDTANTRVVCLATCLANITAPYNEPDGALNPCIQCDEDESGPVFKQVAGRTRRNSGVPNAICRPCSQVQALVHSY